MICVDRKVLKGFGHIGHMSGKHLTKRVYESEVEGRKDRGMPSMRCLDMVIKECNTMSLEVTDAKVKSMDKEQ